MLTEWGYEMITFRSLSTETRITYLNAVTSTLRKPSSFASEVTSCNRTRNAII